MGARVIFFALEKIAEKKRFDIVENAVMMGAPVTSDYSRWEKIREVPIYIDVHISWYGITYSWLCYFE